jgi:RimJ/RimL family protein N-acetyltransferase
MAFRRGGISPFWHDLALCPDELYSFHASRLADLGVIVSAAHRGKGIATKVIKQLIAYARAKELRSQGAKELRPICSTEKGNAGAQKAISRAGFIAHHRIIEFACP